MTSLWRHLHAGIVPAEKASCLNCVTRIEHENCAVVWPGKSAVQVQQRSLCRDCCMLGLLLMMMMMISTFMAHGSTNLNVIAEKVSCQYCVL